MLIPERILATTGGFHENIFMYCEDVDLSWRVRSQGMQTLVAPSALFGHFVKERKSRLIRRLMLESARYLAWKWSAPEFQRHMENLLVTESYYSDTAYLPVLPNVKKLPSTQGIQEWRQLLSFSVPRW